MFEEFTNFRVTILCETQTYPHVLNIEIGHITRWLNGFKLLKVCFNSGRPNNRYSIIRRRGCRPVEVPKLFPRIAEMAQRVTDRQFQHNSSPGVAREGFNERNKVGNVVDDVMTDCDITYRSVVGDRRPVAEHRMHFEIALSSLVGDDVEHPLLMVDAHDRCRRWGETEDASPTTASDIEDRW